MLVIMNEKQTSCITTPPKLMTGIASLPVDEKKRVRNERTGENKYKYEPNVFAVIASAKYSNKDLKTKKMGIRMD